MTTAEKKKVYRCLDCGNHLVGLKACKIHAGRLHKNYTLTDENFDDHFRWDKNPKPEILERLAKKSGSPKKKKTAKKNTRRAISSNAKILSAGKPEIVDGGIVLDLKIKVPISIEIPEVISTAK